MNRALAASTDLVDLVASGKSEVVLNVRFGEETGKEAYRPDADTRPYIRKTYGVRVVLHHDNRSRTGYKVFTAFPVNQRTGGRWVR